MGGWVAGSSEGHMAYCYARAPSPRRSLPLVPVKGDPLFADGLAMIQNKTLDEMHVRTTAARTTTVHTAG